MTAENGTLRLSDIKNQHRKQVQKKSAGAHAFSPHVVIIEDLKKVLDLTIQPWRPTDVVTHAYRCTGWSRVFNIPVVRT